MHCTWEQVTDLYKLIFVTTDQNIHIMEACRQEEKIAYRHRLSRIAPFTNLSLVQLKKHLPQVVKLLNVKGGFPLKST